VGGKAPVNKLGDNNKICFVKNGLMISNVVICETNNHKYLFLVGPIEKWREVSSSHF
jgi:hypothetical protein